MENKNQRVYFVSHCEFDGHEFLGHGIASFVYDHPDMTSPRDWLGKMFDVCMDADHAIVFMCDRCGFDARPFIAPVFMYDGFEGYMLHTREGVCVAVVDPTLEDYYCLNDDYKAFQIAAVHTIFDCCGNPTFCPEGVDKKYFLKRDYEFYPEVKDLVKEDEK